VQISNGRNFVYVLNGDKVSRREVTLGVDGEQWLEIVSGVQPQDELVIAGLEGLSDGTAVRPARNVDPFGGAAASEVKQPQTRQE
jgi:multidrug efflux pump subunit AcrA (membrane-fusion protein)